jgi:uncharacterized protein YecT (DUF1311 family)
MSAGFIAAPNISFAASFDCSKAGTNIEKMICSTESVSQLDEELSKVYKIGIAREQDKKIYQESQSIWLKYNRNSCASADCLADAYKERIKSLNHAMEIATSPVAKAYINSSFVGTYCSNPCTYASSHRPSDISCRFTFGEKFLFLSDTDKKIAKPYSIVSKGSEKLTIEIEGDENSWSNNKLGGVKYQLSFRILPPSNYSVDNAELSDCKVVGSKCEGIGSMQIEMHDVYECQ